MIANNEPFTETVVEGLHEMEATTGFTSDAGVVEAKPLNPVNFDKLVRSATDSTHQDIKSFLEKPVIIASGTLGLLDTVGTFPAVNLPHAPLFGQTTLSRKLDGYFGLRCDMRIRIQINANKFQQGRYMLTYIPTGGSSMSVPGTAAKVLSHSTTLRQRSQLHRVELDLSHDTVGILDIPYSSALNFIPLSGISTGSTIGQLGVLQLFPYSPLVAPTGSTTASYTIWFSMENVELIGVAAPQSARFGSSKKSGRTNPSEQEQKSAGMGPIGSALTKLSTASAMFKPVPLIGQYAGGLSWVSDIAAGAANVFGWCKPLNLDGPNRSLRETLPFVGNVDAPSYAQPLSLSYKNMVDTAVGFSGTTTDELDFKFISTIPAWYDTKTWTSAAAIGAEIFNYEISPVGYSSTRVENTNTITSYTPVAFVADQFTQWRGSTVFTIKLVKTEYHSGRLAFCFFPQESYRFITPTSYALSNYVHREIVDVREQTEITFQVPFISSTPWRPTQDSGRFIGQLVCYVVDPLVAPASVSSTVTLLIEVAGGPDMEFSVPAPRIISPYLNATPQSGMLGINKPHRDTDLYEGMLGNASVVDDATNSAAICVGEKVSSFRTLLKMARFKGQRVETAVYDKFMNVIPFAVEHIVSAPTVTIPRFAPDLYDVLSSIYVYSRGGVRFQYIPVIEGVTGSCAPRTWLSNSSFLNAINAIHSTIFSPSDLVYGSIPRGYNNPVAYSNVEANGGFEVQVPQYARTHSRINSEHYVSATYPYRIQQANTTTRTMMVTQFSRVTPTSVSMSRSGADDLNFGLFVSIPEMYIIPAASYQFPA